MKRIVLVLLAALGGLALPAGAQTALKIKPIAERKVASLPAGTLYWRVEQFATPEAAGAAAGAWSLVAQSAGKTWLFTLGDRGDATPGATPVTEVGPIPRVQAKQYLLRINEATGEPGAVTAIHSHPGSEAFYVVAGEQSIRSPKATMRVRPGQSEAGQGADVAMQVSSSGTEPLHALVMFVVDAERPFSTPAVMP